MNQFDTKYQEQTITVQNTLIRQVYAWMSAGLLVTALMAFFTVSTPALLNEVIGNRLVFYGLIFGELGLVIALSAAISRLNATVATFMFIVYSALNGITISTIFLAYTADSISSTFLVAAGMFGAMSTYGFFTRRDLTSWGSFLFMGLIGVVIASVVNIFMLSDTVSWIISGVGVIVFTGLTAYDSWKIKALAAGGVEGRKPAILGALSLYLDFINLFLMLLRLFGRRR
jgi:FtsH-binding integral membrane protein